MSTYDDYSVDLTITVLDTATIFEGPEAIYRYDLPGTAIVEGSALSGVIDQVKKMFPAPWPQLRVVVLADSSGGPMSHEAVKIIRRQLQVHEVMVTEPATVPATVRDTEPATEAATTHLSVVEEVPKYENYNEEAIIRPVDEPASFFYRYKWLLISAVAAAAIIVLLVVWLLIRSSNTEINEDDTTQPAPATTAAAPATTPVPTPADTPTTVAPANVIIEGGGLRVMLPAGFSHVEEDGLVTATGDDPNLRILMVMDPLYSVPAHALFAEVRAHIDADETLSQPREADGRLMYVEHPGDDSVVSWTTWVEDDQQVSLGCHTRNEPSLAQRAACRMAAESVEKVD